MENHYVKEVYLVPCCNGIIKNENNTFKVSKVKKTIAFPWFTQFFI